MARRAQEPPHPYEGYDSEDAVTVTIDCNIAYSKDRDLQTTGQWYISRPHRTDSEYLHRDGVWRRSTRVDNVWSGYYLLLVDAIAACEAAGLVWTIRKDVL